MKKTKDYKQIRFSSDVIREALQAFRSLQGPNAGEKWRHYMSVQLGDSDWHHDSEDEFFADYRQSKSGAVFEEATGDYQFRLQAFTDSVEALLVRLNEVRSKLCLKYSRRMLEHVACLIPLR